MDILGTGLELIDTPAWNALCRKGGKGFYRKNFSLAEQEYCDQKPFPQIHYSARWACKIAVLQALGFARSKEMDLKCIEIEGGPDGGPKIRLDSNIVSKRKNWIIREVKVSLSHTDAYSVADVLILGEKRKQKSVSSTYSTVRRDK